MNIEQSTNPVNIGQSRVIPSAARNDNLPHMIFSHLPGSMRDGLLRCGGSAGLMSCGCRGVERSGWQIDGDVLVQPHAYQ